MRWTWGFAGTGTMLAALGSLLVAEAPSKEGIWWGWFLVWAAVAIYVVAAVVWFWEHWKKDYDERFDRYLVQLYNGLDRAFSERYTSLILAHKQGPYETWRAAAKASGVWVIAEPDAQLSPESDLMQFAYWVYQGPTMPMNVPDDVHEARKSIAHYLAEVAPKARTWPPLRRWLSGRVHSHRPLVKMLLCVEIALRRRRSESTDLSGTGLEYVPALFGQPRPHT